MLDDERVVEYMTMMAEGIEEHGWMLQGVAPVVGQEGHPFTYTVGLTEMDHPEILMMGYQSAGVILNDMGQRVKDGHVYKAGESYTDLASFTDGGDMELRLVEADAQEFGGIIRTLYPTATGLQVIIPDAQGRFPEDDGYDFWDQNSWKD